MSAHKTVLLEEAVDGLAVKEGGVYVDGTFGRGGHSREILRELGLAEEAIAALRHERIVGSEEAA